MSEDTQPDPEPGPGGPFARRRACIETLPKSDPRRALAVALCAFDERTDPTELERIGKSQLGSDIQAMTQYLVRRLRQRAGAALQDVPFEPPATERGDAKWRQLAARVEACTREAMVAVFRPRPGTRIDMRAWQRTLAAFVGGELCLGNLCSAGVPDDLALHGVPDGPNHLCFVEAAMLFVRLDLQRPFWAQLLPTLVGTVPLFLARYWDRSRRTWASYRVDAAKFVIPGEVILATIDHEFAAMNPSQLAARFGSMLAIALRDDPHLPHPTRTASEFL